MAATPLAEVGDPHRIDALTSDGAIVTLRPAQPDDRAALAAVFPRLPEADPRLTTVALEAGRPAGIACCARHGPDSATGEITVLVADTDRGRGIGALLVDVLAARARREGITRFLGGTRPADTPLRPLVAPRSVAVIGAMRQRGNTGFEIVRQMKEYGYRGDIYPVSDSGRPVCGIPAYRGLAAVPGPVDLLVVAVPADRVPQTLREAGLLGARSAVVLSRGTPGSRGETERAAREHGVRLLGPHSLGLLNTDPRVRLNATVSPTRPPTGGVAMAAQSSAVGITMLEHAGRSGCGIAGFVSLGERLDVSGNDLIDHWYTDPRTRAVALYLDSLSDPPAFARGLRALARRKPVLTLRRARATDLLQENGIIQVAGLDEMMDTARLLADQPLPAGDRLGIVGNAGGLANLAADTAGAIGLTVPRLSPALCRQLPGGSENPVDLGADATPAAIVEAADIVAGSGEIDILLLMVVGTRANVPTAIMTRLTEVLTRHPALTTAVVLSGSADDVHHIGPRDAPVYRQPDRALRALAHAHHYAVWRRRPLGRRAELGGIDATRVRALLAGAVTDERGWLPRQVVVDVLAAYGITVLPAAHVRTGVGAVAAAERLGYPVIVMTADRTAGTGRRDAVRPALRSASAVRAMYDVVTRLHGPDHGVLVQHQHTARMELTAAIVRLPEFGPAVRLGHGQETVIAPVPLTDLDAGRMWCRALGARASGAGRPPQVNTGALEDLVQRLSALAENHPRIAEADLSPLLAGPTGVMAGSARLRLTGPATPAGR
ncbi:GNAT family N-acetyltransferase [Actinoplanes sp. NPDC049802]|uniref:GNAT family N-acetyltransferase n=1 Tax=Actinoplanes sp. NPDC049802 TaxID=3154742 RepID=UPI0033FC7163